MSKFSVIEIVLMREALKQAKIASEKDEVPIGAVVTFDNKVIARAHNQVEMLKDPTAHAEMIAITQATNYLGSKWLEKCSLYVTIEPCSMCIGALVLSRIKKVYFGSRDPKAGACGSLYDLSQDKRLNHRIEVVSGVLEKDCAAILTEFFKILRRKCRRRNWWKERRR